VTVDLPGSKDHRHLKKSINPDYNGSNLEKNLKKAETFLADI
jgi:hypothetical protein